MKKDTNDTMERWLSIHRWDGRSKPARMVALSFILAVDMVSHYGDTVSVDVLTLDGCYLDGCCKASKDS